MEASLVPVSETVWMRNLAKTRLWAFFGISYGRKGVSPGLYVKPADRPVSVYCTSTVGVLLRLVPVLSSGLQRVRERDGRVGSGGAIVVLHLRNTYKSNSCNLQHIATNPTADTNMSALGNR